MATAAMHAFSGALGSIGAMSLMFPLENVRTRMAVGGKQHKDGTEGASYKNTLDCVSKIVQQEGVAGLYRGLEAGLAGVAISSGVYFYWYSLFKNAVLRRHKVITPGTNLVLACAAGVVNVFATTPIWVIQTRLMVQKKRARSSDSVSDPHHYNGVVDGFLKILKHEGIAGLYKGLMPALILVSNPAVQFVVYEQLCSVLNRSRTKRGIKTTTLTSVEVFVIGALAKAVATVLTYPYQVIKSRMQLKGKQEHTTMSLTKKMYEEEGIASFFHGMGAKLSQTVLNSAFMFVFYERILALCLQVVASRRAVASAAASS